MAVLRLGTKVRTIDRGALVHGRFPERPEAIGIIRDHMRPYGLGAKDRSPPYYVTFETGKSAWYDATEVEPVRAARPASKSSQHATKKKSPAQLQREIDEILSRGTVPQGRRGHSNMAKADPPDDDFGEDSWFKKIRAQRGARVATLIAAFKKSPGIIITERDGRRSLVVRSGEMQNRGEGKYRATMFGDDGPRGHITKNSDKELAEELLHYFVATDVRPATDAEVMKWTSTPAFERGSKIVAFTQAANTLSYRAGKTGQRDRAREIERIAHTLVATDMDAAIKLLEDGIKEIG